MLLEDIIGPARPISWIMKFWPVPAAAFVGSLGATWLCKKAALKFGIVDRPDNLVKTHKEPIAYLGGIGMLVGFTVGTLAGIGVIRDELLFSPMLKWLLAVLAGAAVACFVGLDLNKSAEVLNFHIPEIPEFILQSLIVVFFVLGATNSLNLLDGLDGLCAGVTAIITIALLIISFHLVTWKFSEVGDPVRVIICLGLVGGVFGFLPFNRHPAKIFMGDAGSMMLGYVVAALMILFAEQIPRWWLASITVFGFPILDTATALARRLINKRPLFVSDRGHIYDQMIDRGIPLKKTVVLCYFLTALYAFIGVALALTTAIRTIYAFFIYVAVFVVSGLVIWKKGYLRMEGLRGAVRQNHN